MKKLKPDNKKVLSRSLQCLVVGLLGCYLISCGNDSKKNLGGYVKEIKQRPAYPIEPIPKFKPTAKYTYPKLTRRNPFKPILKKRIVTGDSPDQNRTKEPLEAFPIDSLRMVGILERDSNTWAIIAAPDGSVYRVQFGNYLGQNYGKVAEIHTHDVQIQETILINDTWEKRTVTLSLEKEE